jgi:hypothetical protein
MTREPVTTTVSVLASWARAIVASAKVLVVQSKVRATLDLKLMFPLLCFFWAVDSAQSFL